MHPKIFLASLLLSITIFAASPCDQAGVIFCSGFEGTTKELNDSWRNGAVGYYTAVDSGPFRVPGNKVMKYDMFGANSPVELDAPHITKTFTPGYDKLYARWYQKFGPGYNFSLSDHVGLGFCTGGTCGLAAITSNPCTGTDWGLLEPDASGSFHWYVYHPGKSGTWGDVFGTTAAITANKWYCVEILIDMGSPTPTASGATGAFDLWVDGTHRGRKSGVWMRSCATLKLTSLFYLAYERAERNQVGVSVYFDDFVVSTQPIGTGTRVPPATDIRSGQSTVPVHANSFSLSAIAGGNGFLIRYNAPENSGKVLATLYSQNGKKIKSLSLAREGEGCPSYYAKWDGRDSNGNKVPYGIYLAKVNAGMHFVSAKTAILHQ